MYTLKPMELYIVSALAILVGAVIGYLSGYAKKKGENLATHEDIDKLVAQVAAVTTTTKEIEAKITNDVWDQQKRWELKREVLYETTKRVAVIKDALSTLYAIYMTEKESIRKDDPGRAEKRIRVGTEWNDAANALDQATLLVALTCGEGIKNTLLVFALFGRKLAREIIEGRPEAFMSSTNELVAKMDAIMTAMRKEIGIERSV